MKQSIYAIILHSFYAVMTYFLQMFVIKANFPRVSYKILPSVHLHS